MSSNNLTTPAGAQPQITAPEQEKLTTFLQKDVALCEKIRELQQQIDENDAEMDVFAQSLLEKHDFQDGSTIIFETKEVQVTLVVEEDVNDEAGETQCEAYLSIDYNPIDNDAAA
jgi:hypothetical protein